MTEGNHGSTISRIPIPSGWSYIPLEDLLEPKGISYGIVQPGSHEFNGVPIVRVKDVRNGKIDTSSPLRVHPDIEEKYSRTRLKGGEILLTLVGSVGEIAIAPEAISGWNVARAIAVLRTPDDDLTKWIATYLQSQSAQHQMQIWQNTTVQATLNLRDVRRLSIAMPPKHIRIAITKLIEALDNKIAINERIAVTSDAWMRANYDLLSVGAEMVRLDSIGTQVRATIKPENLSGGEFYIGLEHIPRRNIWLTRWGSSSGIASMKSRFKKGDILFGKLRPYFHKVGVALVNGVCSTDILVIRADRPSDRAWLTMALSSDDVVAHATARSDGTRMPRAKWADLAEHKIPLPDSGKLKEFTEKADRIIDRVEKSAGESRALSELRDTLLPELMSGRLRVRDAERIVEDADAPPNQHRKNVRSRLGAPHFESSR
ncbi:restriction endonuclease subunit S [Spirillospora sp. NPDC049652]